MAVTTWGGKQIIDPHMPIEVERVKIPKDDEVEVVDKQKGLNEKEVEVTQKVIPMLPQRLVKKTKEGKYRKFISMLKQLSINVTWIEALEEMLDYSKLMKDLVTKNSAVYFESYDKLHYSSAIFNRLLVRKKEDSRALAIPCTIGMIQFGKALCDSGSIINLMPPSTLKKLGLEASKLTAMRLLMGDPTVKKQIGVLQDVLVQVEALIFLADFVMLDSNVDFEVPIILGKPFLANGRDLVDMERGQIKF
ncbi:uncharacterized protein [Solanum tuberosum]|uniref:uncharacterized protein n=1 Tax=Solanum tuberosum TaxID=4113 RepID=UPI00073A41C9|nr:PREDICTED: uncharacterized protein LOC107061467 [Solanum tuberosum]